MMKLSSHSKVRLKERTDGLTYKQRKALFRLALHNGKSPGSIKDDEKLKQFLMSKQRYNSKVKLYNGYVFIYSKNNHKLYTMYELPEEYRR